MLLARSVTSGVIGFHEAGARSTRWPARVNTDAVVASSVHDRLRGASYENGLSGIDAGVASGVPDGAAGSLVSAEPGARDGGSFTTLWVEHQLYMQGPVFGWRSDGVGGLALIGVAADSRGAVRRRLRGPQRTRVSPVGGIVVAVGVLGGPGTRRSRRRQGSSRRYDPP